MLAQQKKNGAPGTPVARRWLPFLRPLFSWIGMGGMREATAMGMRDGMENVVLTRGRAKHDKLTQTITR